MVESIRAHGVLVPAIVRTSGNGTYEMLAGYKVKITLKATSMLHQRSKQGGLTEDGIRTLLLRMDKNSTRKNYCSMKVSRSVYKKYFQDKAEDEVASIVKKALELYFKQSASQGKEDD